jgi:hypothetical protein
LVVGGRGELLRDPDSGLPLQLFDYQDVEAGSNPENDPLNMMLVPGGLPVYVPTPP